MNRLQKNARKLNWEWVVSRVLVAPWVNYMGIKPGIIIHPLSIANILNLFIFKLLYLFDRPTVYLIDPKLWLNSFRQYWYTYMWYQSRYIIILYNLIRECWQFHGNGAVPGSSNSIEGKNIFKLLLKINYNGNQTLLWTKY